jgi:hypothetical protein
MRQIPLKPFHHRDTEALRKTKEIVFLFLKYLNGLFHAFQPSLDKGFFSVPLPLCGKNLCIFLRRSAIAVATAGCLFLGSSISVFSSPLSDFDTRPGWNELFGKDRLLAHLIETGDPQTDRIHRTWLENEIAHQFRQPAIFSSIRESLLQGDSRLQAAMEDSLLSLNLPSDYVRSHLLEWILGSDAALRPHLLSFSTSPAIRNRFASYFLQYHPHDTLHAQWIRQTCETQNPLFEREIRKRVSRQEQIDWSLLSGYSRLNPSAQLHFRWKLFEAIHASTASPLISLTPTPSFADHLWREFFQKIEETPALRQEYITRTRQRTEPEQWTREALTDALRSNEADAWFQAYLRSAQIPQSRYRAVFDSLIQSRSEKRMRPEQIAESSQERTEWRSRLIQLIQKDPRWSSYFLWHFTRASEPVTLQIRRSLPSLFAQRETLTLEWYRWTGGASPSLTSSLLKAWGVRWGESLRDQEMEWKKLWLHHDLPTQALLQKTLLALLDENPVLVTTWVHIVDRHQAPLQNAFALWTRQNSPHPEMTNLPLFMKRLVESVQRKEWIGNVDLAVFRAAFGNFLLSHEGWHQVRWRIGIETFEIAQPLRELVIQHWTHHPENFWRLYAWRSVFCPEPSSQQKIRSWIQSQKIAEKTLLAISQQNPGIQTAIQSFWIDLFDQNPEFPKSLHQRALHPTLQDDLDQILAAIPQQKSAPQIPLREILLRGGDASLADWILRSSELQVLWRDQLENQLVQNPMLFQSLLKSLISHQILTPNAFTSLIQITIEDRLLFESLLSDPTLGFKNQIQTTPHTP